MFYSKPYSLTDISVEGTTETTGTKTLETITGYTPIGVIGYTVAGTGSTQANVKNIRVLSAGTLNYHIFNLSSTSRTWSLKVYILYVKNATFG